MDDQTLSVSKGVFVFKNNFKRCRNPRRKNSLNIKDVKDTFRINLWYDSYSQLWNFVEEKIEGLNNEIFSSVLNSLLEFVTKSHVNSVDEIPTAMLLTGINMPDHGAQFLALSKSIKHMVTPHVACLYSQNCTNLKYLMEHMVDQFINEDSFSSRDEEDLNERNMPYLKKNQLNLSVLQCWYENLYKENVSTTPKKQKTKNKKNLLVVIIPDFESFNCQVLEKFIMIISWYIRVLPFVFIFGVATSLMSLHISLPYKVLSKINIQVFNSPPSTVYLNTVLENVFFSFNCPFHLGGKVFNLFTDIFLFYDLSVSNFIQNMKYAMAEHFSYGNAMSLCNSDKKQIKEILNNFTNEDCENVRHLMSFRKLVENESYENQIKLLTDDEYFKLVLEQEISKINKHLRRLHLFLKCLFILVEDLPNAPLGRQIRELYALAVSKNITTTTEYKECFQLLGFQSKDELCFKLQAIVNFLSDVVNENQKQNKIKDFIDTLKKFIDNLDNMNINETLEEVREVRSTDVFTSQMDRKQLKEKLLGLSKQQNKPMNRYETVRKNIMVYLMEIFEKYLFEPSSMYFYEIFFFDNIAIHNNVIGTHRSAIHNALSDPQYYLQCSCCEILDNSTIRSCMPDISIVYKLHLECGKLINLYDWLQAFLSFIDSLDVKDEYLVVDPQLQARFTQAVAELEYLGFIKKSKRKADHVTRLTWGG